MAITENRKCGTCGKEFNASVFDLATRVGSQHYCAEHLAAAQAAQAQAQAAELSRLAESAAAFEEKQMAQRAEREARKAADNQVRAELAQAYAKKEADAQKTRRSTRRSPQNEYLFQNGYHWNKVQDFLEDDYIWELTAPDGRVVTVSQALAEIEHGIEHVQAEINEREAKQQAELQEVERQNQEDMAVQNAFDREIARRTTGMVKVNVFDYDRKSAEVMQMPKLNNSWRAHDKIISTTHNGVSCVITITGTGIDDDGYYTYYCSDPDAAGLSVAAPDEHKHFSDIFG